jgi:hypothetical protein
VAKWVAAATTGDIDGLRPQRIHAAVTVTARVLCRLRMMRRVVVAGIALLCSAAVFAQSPEAVRHHQAMDDSLTGARIGEMTVVIRDQVYRNGAFDVLFSAYGVDGVYSHRTLAPAVVIDRYALRESGEILEVERSLVLPSDDLNGKAWLRFDGREIAGFAMPLDEPSRTSLRRVLDEKLPRSFQVEITRLTGFTPFELAASMMSSRANRAPAAWRISVPVIAPDCAFDARFGLPCSADQKQAVAAAAREGLVLESY